MAFGFSRRGLLAGGAAACVLPMGVPGVDAAADPAVVGQWSPAFADPIVAIHANMLPSGDLLVYSDAEVKGGHGPAGRSVAYVLTIPNGQPLTESVLVTNNDTNLFCSGSALMADGRVFVTGGHNGKNYFGVPDVTSSTGGRTRGGPSRGCRPRTAAGTPARSCCPTATCSR